MPITYKIKLSKSTNGIIIEYDLYIRNLKWGYSYTNTYISGSRQAELFSVHTPNNIYQYYISNKNHSIVDDGQKYP